MPDLFNLLKKLNISYEHFEHPAVFTCAESEKLDVEMPGAHTKQLLMRDKKKRHYVLVVVMHDKSVNTKALGEQIGTSRLSFASPEDLKKFLGVEPGSVTPFGLMFDHDHEIKVFVDEDAWEIGAFLFHPLVNTATLTINREGFERFLGETGHGFKVIEIPQKHHSLPTSSEPSAP